MVLVYNFSSACANWYLDNRIASQIPVNYIWIMWLGFLIQNPCDVHHKKAQQSIYHVHYSGMRSVSMLIVELAFKLCPWFGIHKVTDFNQSTIKHKWKENITSASYHLCGGTPFGQVFQATLFCVFTVPILTFFSGKPEIPAVRARHVCWYLWSA